MARVRKPPRKELQEAGALPAALALGRCIEVWSDNGEFGSSPSMSAFSRWGRVRSWWLAASGVTETAEQCRLLPLCGPWSLEFLAANNRADDAMKKLRTIGATPDDLPRLREQAIDLHNTATAPERGES